MPKKIILLLVSLILTNCEINKTNKSLDNGAFAHMVYFWLKNPDNIIDLEAFETSLVYFIKYSKFIKTRHIGTPAHTKREVIDNSYNYCLSLTFENKAMHDNYQDEPNHKKFIDESAHFWKKVVVYDSVNFLE